jgi:hypothetical protein
MRLLIDPGGTVHCVYAEAIDLAALGTASIRRASHVEPDEQGQWWADLSPVGGPRLGPFPSRSPALDAEHAWLEEYWLSGRHVTSTTRSTSISG